MRMLSCACMGPMARSLALLFASSLALAACGQRTPQTPVIPVQIEAPDRHEAASSPAQPQLARAASVTLRTVEGQSVVLPDPNRRPTALFFMASWCLPCVRGAAMLGDLYKQYKDKGFQVVVIDVDTGDTPQDLARFRELAGNPAYFWAIDEGQRATSAYRVRALDATVVIDGRGFVVFRSESLPPEDALRRAVASLFP